ncbi:MAG: arginine N-succinyltransferase [Planctomycetaceae bacterium]|nr:arginine N-succinyltransferase [Planctomycetaceae bacterium]
MLRVRPAVDADLDPLYALILRSDDGLTSLKITRDQLHDRLENSTFAFRRQSQKMTGLPYVFVMEDLTTGAVVGTSSIYSKVGGYEPFYAYQIEKSIHESKELGVYREIDVLHLHKEHDGPTEIGSLFLLPEYWGKGNGKLLSLSRFLYMAEFPERFDAITIAEMRGVIDRQGRSPFWDALGSHFFQIEFPRAVMLLTVSKNFVADLMPTHPIYLPLLPQDARDVVGQVHQDTRPALAMLQKQGFSYQGFVDIFDGGPVMHATTAEIATIANSRRYTVAGIGPVQSSTVQVVSRAGSQFSAVIGPLDLHETEATLSPEMANALNLRLGDVVRVARA